MNKFDWTTVGVMSTVAVGVMIASYGALAPAAASPSRLRPFLRPGETDPGARRPTSPSPRRAAGEIHFVLTGVLFMLASLATESNRIVLVQKLLQAKGVQLNPVTTMYYVSPCCFAFLVLPWRVTPARAARTPRTTFSTPTGSTAPPPSRLLNPQPHSRRLVIELPELRDTVIPRDRFGDDAWLDTNGAPPPPSRRSHRRNRLAAHPLAPPLTHVAPDPRVCVCVCPHRRSGHLPGERRDGLRAQLHGVPPHRKHERAHDEPRGRRQGLARILLPTRLALCASARRRPSTHTPARLIRAPGDLPSRGRRMLIYLSHAIFGAPVTALSVGGYLIAFAAVMFYNYLKYKQMSGEDQRKHDPAHGHGGRKAGVRGVMGGVLSCAAWLLSCADFILCVCGSSERATAAARWRRPLRAGRGAGQGRGGRGGRGPGAEGGLAQRSQPCGGRGGAPPRGGGWGWSRREGVTRGARGGESARRVGRARASGAAVQAVTSGVGRGALGGAPRPLADGARFPVS